MEIEKEFNRQYKLEGKSLLTQIMSKDELFKEYLKTEKKPNLRLFISDKLNFYGPESEINTFVGNSKNEAKLRELINEFDKIKNDLPKSFWSHFLEDIPINATLKKIEKAHSLFVELVEDSGFDIYKETEATAEAIKGCLKELGPEAASSIIKDMTEWTELDDLICWKKTDEQRRKWQRMKNALKLQFEKPSYKEPEATEYDNLLSLLNGGLDEEIRLEGVNQETLSYVIKNKELPPKAAMGIWVGERPEAWIFATHFGLDYAPFNKCFKMENGRKLHSNDKARSDWEPYKIEKILGIK